VVKRKPTSVLGTQPTWVFSSPRRFWDKTNVVQLLKKIIILITTSVMVKNDVVSPSQRRFLPYSPRRFLP